MLKFLKIALIIFPLFIGNNTVFGNTLHIINNKTIPDSVYNIPLDAKSFSSNKPDEILGSVSEQTGISFSYKSSIFEPYQKYKISGFVNNLGGFLNDLESKTGISASFIPPATIILTKNNDVKIKNRYTISGIITDSLSGERLYGSSIKYLENSSTFSNYDGFYSISVKPGQNSIKVNYLGYISKTITLNVNSDLRLDISLSSSNHLIGLIDIRDSSASNSIIQDNSNKLKIKSRQINELSPLFGESDVFRTLQLMPGILSVGEGSPGLFVRGGGPDQNLVLIDGIQIYNPVHIFGFYSIFNPGIVKNVSLDKGSFSAEYGGRLSSVIDISTKDGNNNKFSGEAMLGLIGSRLTLEGPIGKNKKTTYIFSGRRSHIDLLMSPFIDANISTNEIGFLSAYYFYDLNGKIVHRFNKSSKLSLNFYKGEDVVSLSNSFKLDNPLNQIKEIDKQVFSWGNTIVSANYSQILSSKLIFRLSSWFSTYTFGNSSFYSFEENSTNNTTENFYDYKFNSHIRDFGFKADADYYPFDFWKVNFGSQVIFHNFQPGITSLTSNIPNIEQEKTITEITTGLEPAYYIDNKLKIFKNLKINIGMYLSSFITERKNYFSSQPRLLIEYQPIRKLTINAGYAEMEQYMHLLTNSTIGIPRDLWILSNDRISPQSNKQRNAGIKYTEKQFSIGADVFVKKMNNVLEYKDGTNFQKSNDNWEDKVTRGSGNASGVEFYLEKSTGKITGWISYTISKSTRQFDEINNGEEFFDRYNRLHDFSSSFSYQINDRNVISANFIYASGNRITIPEYVYAGNSVGMPPIEIYISGKRNNYPMPDYHRLDLNYSNYKKNKLGRRIWSFGFYNVYNRKNPFFISPGYDDAGNRVLRQTTLFPLIPSVTYRQEF